jgi:DUF1680 family protein
MMERSIYNALFAAQSPDGRDLRYYTAFEGEKKYFHGDSYCCPNNFRRIIAELPLMIYYTKPEGGLAVNLYTTSSANTHFADGTKVTVEQNTDYPNSGQITLQLKLSKSRNFPLALRIPAYAKNTSVKVNGTPVNENVTAGEFFTLDRKWKSGDKIEIDFPMDFRLIEGRKRQSGRVAVMRGPLVYGLSRETNPTVDPKKSRSYQTLEKITLNPSSMVLTSDTTVRQNGTACKIGAWGTGFVSTSGKNSYELLLTEFTDPNGVIIYFRLPDVNRPLVVKDELGGEKVELSVIKQFIN